MLGNNVKCATAAAEKPASRARENQALLFHFLPQVHRVPQLIVTNLMYRCAHERARNKLNKVAPVRTASPDTAAEGVRLVAKKPDG